MPLGARLAVAGIATTSVVADHDMEGTEAIAKTFHGLRKPAGGRWPATETTDQALRAIDEIGTRRLHAMQPGSRQSTPALGSF
jgi:hypothetical protein